MELSIENLGYLLNKSTHLLKADLSTRLSRLEMTVPQWAVLRDLYEQEELPLEERKVTPAHVAERLHADRPTISGITYRLMAKDFLKSIPHPSDRRSQLLLLTDKSRELLPQIERMSRESIEQALSGIEQSDIQQLVRSLQRMISNLQRI